jgi:hypothetical protein
MKDEEVEDSYLSSRSQLRAVCDLHYPSVGSEGPVPGEDDEYKRNQGEMIIYLDLK